MEVSEEPVLIFQFSVHHLQKFREMVCLVVTVHSQSDAGGGAVGDYIVYSPVCLIQCPQGGVVFFIGGQLFRPPGAAQYPESVSAGALQYSLFGMEVRIRRIQDAVFHIVLAPPIVKKVLPPIS